MPQRIQLSRKKGYRMPLGCVAVTRPGPFGNPFTLAGYLDVWNPKATPEEAARGCVGMFRDWLAGHLNTSEDRRKEVLRRLPELRGKDLGCWCRPGAPCHADVLIEYANRAEG